MHQPEIKHFATDHRCLYNPFYDTEINLIILFTFSSKFHIIMLIKNWFCDKQRRDINLIIYK